MSSPALDPANFILLGIIAALAGAFLFVLFRLVRRTSARQSQNPRVAAPSEPGNQQFMMATFEGVITKLKEQERELERLHRIEKERAELSQRISENITRNMPTGLVTINRNGVVTSSNPAAKEILQLQLLETLHYRQVLSASRSFQEMVADCLTTGKRYHRAEVETALNNATAKTLGISVSPIESGKGEISGVVCLISDLTELSALQRLVRLKEGLAMLGEMSAGIAHEFKNALATIAGYAQLLQDEALPQNLVLPVKMIRKETSKLTSTINEFLNYARPQSANRKELDLAALLRDCVGEIGMDPRFRHVRFHFEGDARAYQGDEVLLRSAFGNLLLNAAESIAADASGGEVHCTIRARNGLEVVIRDNGCGIEEADKEKLFIPFFTRKSEGTGLGLPIVQKIVLMHDGRIELESEVGAGTAFRIFL
ncbi:MAG: ATP-binding protein [Acidobacteriota bacterium]